MDRNDLIRRIKNTKAELAPLLTQYEAVAKGAKDESGKERPFTPEEWANHERLGTDINNLNKQLISHGNALQAVDLYDRDEERTAEMLGLSDAKKLPQATEAYQDAFLQFARGGFDAQAAAAAFSGPEFKNLTTVSPSTGGVLIPTEIERDIFMEAIAESALLDLSDVSFTNTIHGQIPFMGSIGVLAPRKEAEAYLKTEPTLSAKSIDIFNYGGMFPVSQELMEDFPALAAAFREVFGNAYVETIEEYGIKGTTGQTSFFNQADGAVTVTLAGRVCPGILSASGSVVPVVTAADDTTVSTGDVIALKQKVKSAARPKGTYLFSGDFETKILQLKDADGRPLWQPNLIAGQPAMLNGSPYRISDRLAAVAAETTPALFGDFKKGHQIKIRKGLTVKTSGHYLFGNGMIAVAADVRWGAMVKYANYIARLNMAAA